MKQEAYISVIRHIKIVSENPYQHILRFHVTVKKTMLVHESHALKYLVHNIPDFGFRKVSVSIFH